MNYTMLNINLEILHFVSISVAITVPITLIYMIFYILVIIKATNKKMKFFRICMIIFVVSDSICDVFLSSVHIVRIYPYNYYTITGLLSFLPFAVLKVVGILMTICIGVFTFVLDLILIERHYQFVSVNNSKLNRQKNCFITFICVSNFSQI